VAQWPPAAAPAVGGRDEEVLEVANDDLTADVQSELADDPDLDSSELEVTTEGGTVVLNGTVPTYWDKYTAEADAWRVDGVHGVDNGIVVDLADEQVLDHELEASALAGLDANRLVPKGAISIKVDDGWVTMDGNVHTPFERQAAEHVIKHLRGLRGFSDNVTVSRDPSKDVARDISAALQRSATIDASGVQVSDDKGVVTLTGSVRSDAERVEAEQAAWRAHGVVAVDDRIEISPVPAGTDTTTPDGGA
jgi:osmotically-inducible protein OsmY